VADVVLDGEQPLMSRRRFTPVVLIVWGAFAGCTPRPSPALSVGGGPGTDGGAGPTVLYFLPRMTARHSMGALALSQDYVNFAVWTGGVYRIPKYGGEAVAIEEDGSSYFRYIGARADTVVWVRAPYDAQGRSLPPLLKEQTIGQDPVTLLDLAADSQAPEPFIPALQVTGTDVFFNDGSSTINQVALAGGAPTTIALPDQVGQPDWLADDSFVYFLAPGSPGGCTLSRLPLGGAAAQALAACPTGAAVPWLVGIDATDAYLGSASGLWRVPKDGGTPASIYVPPGTDFILPGLAAVDDQNVYFMRRGATNRILTSVPKAGGAASTVWDGVRSGLDDAFQMAQDGPSLFTLNPWGILVFPKTPAD
jgi:hypothetical protein